MHALLIAMSLLGAKPAAVQVSLEDYVTEVQAIIAKADESKTPEAEQKALAKGITELNQKYKSSKARLTLTCPVRTAGSALMLDQAEETAGLSEVQSTPSLPSRLVTPPVSKLPGGVVIISGTPYVSLNRRDERCTVLRKKGNLYIHLSAERFQTKPAEKE